jgi:hypothetical protein
VLTRAPHGRLEKQAALAKKASYRDRSPNTDDVEEDGATPVAHIASGTAGPGLCRSLPKAHAYARCKHAP